jgi:hypothetical protein
VRTWSRSVTHTFVPLSPCTSYLRNVDGQIDLVFSSIRIKIAINFGTAKSGWQWCLSYINKLSHILSPHYKCLPVVPSIWWQMVHTRWNYAKLVDFFLPDRHVFSHLLRLYSKSIVVFRRWWIICLSESPSYLVTAQSPTHEKLFCIGHFRKCAAPISIGLYSAWSQWTQM